MNILIIEDEEQAAKKLIRMVRERLPETFIHGPIESVEASVNWLNNNPAPDLILMDIHLSDGLSFDIFGKVEVSVPVLFTTAYDQYALRAFKVNSVDYLLKPIGTDELNAAFAKFETRYGARLKDEIVATDRYSFLKSDYENTFKQRFVTRVGDRIVAIQTEDIAYGYSENKATYLKSFDGKSYLIDYSLEQLEDLLDPQAFFRLNRQYVTRFKAIDKMLAYSNSRLKIELINCDDKHIVLSREKTALFKVWIDK